MIVYCTETLITLAKYVTNVKSFTCRFNSIIYILFFVIYISYLHLCASINNQYN